ncbi:hypothetical protein PR202_ga01991 [Eleusine coracana subsp. coracana]|uniref:F-box domain-containing protein n=1 Tax=Eleusine coracana subsp. coracana TaxID=191504 RepID=A0AAV5BIA7_ELECO|nr:hypothetical protein PR202_ga01304 [Eleusine coracana subsp. coracana]GJM86161.1 hypothetical protein PR202_ga01991 [Eleusine coracana subsp. coracana]
MSNHYGTGTPVALGASLQRPAALLQLPRHGGRWKETRQVSLLDTWSESDSCIAGLLHIARIFSFSCFVHRAQIAPFVRSLIHAGQLPSECWMIPMKSNKRMKTEEAPSIIVPAAALPDEIVTEVLLRLPVKSLLRFRAVCRSWAATISSDAFCALHMAMPEDDGHHTSLAQTKLLAVAPTAAYDATALYSCSPQGPRADLLFTLDDVKGDFVDGVAAPCRGLTLLYDAVAPAYYVVNPSTRAFTRLPPCLDVRHSSVGLAFDARAKEYKVMRLFTKQNDPDMTCEVYTLGAHSWRPAVEGVVPEKLSAAAQFAVLTAATENLPPVLANGSLHWQIEHSLLTRDPAGVAILTFSVTEETFGWVQSPPFGTLGVHLVELGGCLCAVRDLRHASPDDGSNTLEIWKQQDYPAGTWFLDNRIDLPQQHLATSLQNPRVLGALGDGRSMQKIIMATSDHSVHAYHVMSRKLETIIPIADTAISYRRERRAIRICLFKETLVPVHQTPEEILFSSPMGKATKEILLRLPARSVARCKLVCNQWRRFAEDQTFIRSYSAHKSNEKKIKIMLVGKGTGRSFFSFAPLAKWPANKDAWLGSKVVCSKPCHGLNLLSTAKMDYLYNPCTGYHKTKFYPGTLDYGPWDTPNDCWRVPHNAFAVGNKNVGLGFNPVKQEHVAVIILYEFKDFKSRRCGFTCSAWRCTSASFQQHLDPPLPVNDMPPAYVDGVLYWMNDPRLGPCIDHAIVSFDIATEEFYVIPCPPHIAKWNGEESTRRLSVVELWEKLCIVVADVPENKLVIWKLEHGQWNRACTVCLKASSDYSLASNLVMPLAVDPEDGRILLSTGRRVGIYDPVKETIEELYAAGKHRNKLTASRFDWSPCIKSAVPPVPMLYEESLVSYPRRPKQRFLQL